MSSSPLRSIKCPIGSLLLHRSISFYLSIAAAATVGIVLFLSLKTSPKMRQEPWIPSAVAAWADSENGVDARTAVPFLILGAIAASGWRYLPGRRARCLIFFAVVALPCGVEALQALIPTRDASIRDVVWAWAGLLFGASAARTAISIFLWNWKKNHRS